MRVAVIGAGIVGVTSAYELASDGHEVEVFEAGSAVAGGASFANAGVLAPGYVAPWAAPGLPGKLLRSLLSRHAPMRLRGLAALGMMPWLWRWWRACHADAHRGNRERMFRLACYSRERLEGLTQGLRLEYERGHGFLVLLRSDGDLRQARAGIKLLSELGVAFELLDATRSHAVEPGLNTDMPLRAAIHLPRDGVGNCRQFAHLLKAEAQQRGARFHFGRPVTGLRPGAPATLRLPAGDQAFDAVVVCAGVASAGLLAPLGLKLPLAPVWGHSLTVPLRHVDGLGQLGPRGALMDERYKVALSRLGRRVRVSGGGELGGRAGTPAPAALATLYKVLHDWFPGSAHLAQAQPWKGARPMLPDGPPLLGASGMEGVWLNLGHGASGWALAAGSARVLADQMAGRSPAIDVTGLGIERLT